MCVWVGGGVCVRTLPSFSGVILQLNQYAASLILFFIKKYLSSVRVNEHGTGGVIKMINFATEKLCPWNQIVFHK